MVNDVNLKRAFRSNEKQIILQISAKSMLAINQLTNQVKEINEKLAEGVE